MSDAFVEHARPQDVFGILGQHMLMDGFHLVMDLDKSQGSWIVDARDGRRILDFYSFFATAPLGHNHPRLREPEFQAHLGRIAVNKPANSDVYTTAYADWVETFSRHALPPYLKYLFWIDGGGAGGGERPEGAFDWKVRKNLARGRGEKGSQVLHFKDAFHGRSGYTLSLTNTADPRKYQYFPKFDWPRILNPRITFPWWGRTWPGWRRPRPRPSGRSGRAVERDPDDIACLIIEPIQGEGGDHHFRGEFLRKLSELSKEYDFLYIFDEVQTGFAAPGCGGPTSTSAWNPISSPSVRRPRYAAWPRAPDSTRLRTSSRCQPHQQYLGGQPGGHGAGSAHRGSDRGGGSAGLQHSAGRTPSPGTAGDPSGFSEVTSNPRGRGLFCAIDLLTPEFRAKVIAETQRMGMVIMPTGCSGLRFRPALNLRTEDLDLGVDMLREAIRRVAEQKA